MMANIRGALPARKKWASGPENLLRRSRDRRDYRLECLHAAAAPTPLRLPFFDLDLSVSEPHNRFPSWRSLCGGSNWPAKFATLQWIAINRNLPNQP
jgi:hypothetical protein